MKNRNVEFFNLSFLDLLSGALAAIIFLFIIVPKGNVTVAETPLPVSYDTLQMKFFGDIPDTLMTMREGDTLLAIITGYDKAPKTASPKPIPKPTPKPAPKPKEPKKPEEPKEDPQAAKTPVVKPAELKGSKPDVPCVLSIEMKWDDKKDNVDLYVCKDNDCVFGGRRYRSFIGYWDSGKARSKLFGADLRTNQEAVRQFDEIIPGEYMIYAQYKDSDEPKSNLPIQLQVYTKNEDGTERGEVHHFTLDINPTPNDKTSIARAIIGPDGEIEFKTFK